MLVIFSLQEQIKCEEEEENQRPPPVPAPQNPPETFRRLPEIPRDEPEEEAQARHFLLYFHCSEDTQSSGQPFLLWHRGSIGA